MPLPAKLLIAAVLLCGVYAGHWSLQGPSSAWLPFCIYLAMTLASTGMKVPLPSNSGTMSLNYPFIFLAILQLSPLQACLLTALSVAAQCRVRVKKVFSFVQIAFNIANSITSAAVAYICCTWLRSHGVAAPPAIAIAAVAYFFASSVPVAVVIGWSQQQRSSYDIWKKQFGWFLPFYVTGAILAAVTDLVSKRYGWGTAVLALPVVYTVYRSYLAQVRSIEERQRHLDETEALHLRTIEGLAMAIEAKDQNTHEHLFRVRDYVKDIASVMQLDDLQKKALQTAAFLHDIGKLAVPEYIINKPGKLTAEEFEKMKIHPVVGADILERVRFPYPVVPIVRSHHERWDGKGYPDGLQGEDIPIGARILSVVDCFDALASDRPYRKAMPLEKAMSIVKEMAGTQFDPNIVDILEQRYQDMMSAEANTGTFVPLDLNVDVSRGDSPAAGFASEDGAVAHGKPLPLPDDDVALAGAPGQPPTSVIAISEAAAVLQLAEPFPASLTLSETGAIMAARLRALVPFDCCAVYLRDKDLLQDQFLFGEYTGCFVQHPIPVGEGISGWVAQSGRPIVNGNATVEPNYREATLRGQALQSALAIPLCEQGSEIFAVLTLYSGNENAFTRDHLRIVQGSEAHFSLALQRAIQVADAGSQPATGEAHPLQAMEVIPGKKPVAAERRSLPDVEPGATPVANLQVYQPESRIA
ncbi:MAG: HD domain-containing phosphohydrolase [Janthinobacterium lividum]